MTRRLGGRAREWDTRITDEILVIGAGIGGASTALALQRAGFTVRLLERAPRLEAVGAAIQIWVNGALALAHLGVLDAVRRTGEAITVHQFRTSRGKRLFDVPVADLAERFGLPPPVLVKRADLLSALTGELHDGVLQLGTTVTGVAADDDGVTVQLADGGEVRASVVVAADGIDSPTRKTLFGPSEPRPAGYDYLRGLTTHRDPSVAPGEFRFTVGRGDRFGIHAGERWSYWFGVLLSDPEDGDAAGGRKQELLDRFRDFGATVAGFIESVPEAEIGRTPIRDLEPLSSVALGRVALAGDAGHATTPNLGRGACEALEDAVSLARHLSEPPSLDDTPSVAAALRRYDEERRPAAAAVQTRARRIGNVLGFRDPVRMAVREQMMRRVQGPRLVDSTAAEFRRLAERAAT